MKSLTKHRIFIVLLILPLLINASVNTQRQADTARVKQQLQHDKNQKDAIIKSIHEFMQQINSTLGNDSALIPPIDPHAATEAVDHPDDAKGDTKTPAREAQQDKQSLLIPTKGKTTSKYGYRQNPVTKRFTFHKGIDIAAPKGTTVVASLSGTVIASRYMRNGYGNCIIIAHQNEITTLYAHLEKRFVKTNDTVAQGQPIGTVGATGRATGPHLHFEVFKGSHHIDPEELIHNQW